MKSSWYNTSRICTALRKHVLRVDLCILIDDEEAFTNINFLNSTIKSILTASIIKGLDIIGILTKDTPSIGWKAVEMAKSQQMDLVVLPGQTYVCADGELLYIYKLKQPMPLNLSLSQACEYAHKKEGYVVATNIKKRQVAELEKLQGSLYAPDAIEIFNEKVGGYRDLNIDYPKFVTSGATTANELENTNVFTLLERKKAQEIKFLAPDEGVDYVPKYLRPKNQGVI